MSDQPSIVSAGGWCAPSTTIYDIAQSGTREQLLWRGLVEPTPEERQVAADALYEQEVQDNRAWFVTGVFLEQVRLTVLTGLAMDLLELHRRDSSNDCINCHDGYGDMVQWPCATARLVLSENFDLPEEFVYDKPEPVLQDADNPRWPFPAEPVVTEFTIPEFSVPRGGIKFGGQS